MTATLAARPVSDVVAVRAASTVRVVPAPRSEPPTDDELRSAGVEIAPVTATLMPVALPMAIPGRPRARHPVAEADGAPHAGSAAPVIFEPETPARIATRRFLAVCAEVIGGFRPMSHLRVFCRPDRFADISDRLMGHQTTGVTWRSRGLAHMSSRTPIRGRSAVAPPRGGRVTQTSPSDRVFVRRMQVCEAVRHVAEVAVVLCWRDRVWAMALRMEFRQDRWVCSELEVL